MLANGKRDYFLIESGYQRAQDSRESYYMINETLEEASQTIFSRCQSSLGKGC